MISKKTYVLKFMVNYRSDLGEIVTFSSDSDEKCLCVFSYKMVT